MLIKRLGNTIKERRKVLKITQNHLAELVGVHVNTVMRIENGKINPSIEVVNSILDVLGMELSVSVKG